jgi:site-specific recombinase XerD
MAINTFSVQFLLKKDKLNKEGFAPIFAKVTLNGSKMELSTSRMIEPSNWLPDKRRAKVQTEKQKQLNEHLESFKTKLYATYSKLLHQEDELTTSAFRDALKGKKVEKVIEQTLVATATEHNIQFEKQVGEKYSYGSFKNYKTTLKYLIEFVPLFSGKKDIPLKEVGYKFCEAYFNWLTTEKDCHTNGANKQIQRLKKILNYAILSGYIQVNPAARYSLEFKPHQKIALTQTELEILGSLSLQRKTLEEVRDIFLFQCYTGLSYGDIYSLTSENLQKAEDGSTWIKMQRQKTGISFSVPLLRKAESILGKYVPLQGKGDRIFPVLSNQKMNQNLKVVQELAGIAKSLTTHLGRHTFATCITLSNGVPIETVSRMLGHTKLSTTQVYAKVIDTKIGLDMKALKDKLGDG